MQKNVIEAQSNEVFHISYTLKLDKRIFYKFYTSKYEVLANKYRFFDACVPRTTTNHKGQIIQLSQPVRSPELDTSVATIFILKVRKPDWFNITEEDVLRDDTDSELGEEQELQEIIQNIVLDPLLRKAQR